MYAKRYWWYSHNVQLSNMGYRNTGGAPCNVRKAHVGLHISAIGGMGTVPPIEIRIEANSNPPLQLGFRAKQHSLV